MMPTVTNLNLLLTMMNVLVIRDLTFLQILKELIMITPMQSDLLHCDNVLYEVKSNVPGLKFTRNEKEGWTLIKKRKQKKQCADNMQLQ